MNGSIKCYVTGQVHYFGTLALFTDYVTPVLRSKEHHFTGCFSVDPDIDVLQAKDGNREPLPLENLNHMPPRRPRR